MMKNNIFNGVVIAGLLLALFACENEDNSGQPPVAEPIVLKREYDSKTVNNRSFAIDLFKTTVAYSKGENILISPYSMNVAFNMVWNGTTGETSAEMNKALRNESYTKEQINDYSKTLTDALLKVDPSTELKIANSMWADHTTPFLSSFVETNRTWYNAVVKNVDFTNTATLKEIDRWCLDNTNNKIKDISEGMDKRTRFALINTVYFKGKWRSQFKKSATQNEPFLNRDGKETIVKMMNQEQDFLYTDDNKEWKMLSLPYGNAAFSMVILMPLSDEPLANQLSSLTVEGYYSLWEGLKSRPVMVKLPAFKSEYKYEPHRVVFPEMGMKRLFTVRAEMDEMCNIPMFVDMVLHKTYIEVSEEGTEAAAATAVSGFNASSGAPLCFFINRPFIYTIMENSTGTILFMGQVNQL